MRKLSFLLLATLAWAQTREKRVTPVDPSAQQTFEKQTKIAMLVGVGGYPQASGLGALKYPARDVALLADELQKKGYLVRKLVDSDATRGVVRRVMKELGGLLERDQGTFLFYFSGHGFAQDGINYLATFGSTSDDLKSDGLAVPDVAAILRSSHARQTMMFIDACRSDPAAASKSGGTRSFAALTEAQGLRALYSTREGHVSYESDELQQGVFTYFLVRGLRGEAAGPDGLVTFRDLTDYMTEQVRAWGVRAGMGQLPYEAGESSGDFLVVRSTAPSPPPLTPPGPPPPAPSAPSPRVAPIMVGKIDVSRFAGVRPGDPADRPIAIYGDPKNDGGSTMNFGQDSVGLEVTVDPPRGDSRIVAASLYVYGAEWVKARAGSDELVDLLGKPAAAAVAALGRPSQGAPSAAKGSLVWRLPQGGDLTIAVENGDCQQISLHWVKAAQ